MISLNLVKNHQTFQVVQIKGGRGILKKTLELGIIPNSEWKLISNYGIGPIVIQKDEMKVGLGHEMAKNIYVKVKGKQYV